MKTHPPKTEGVPTTGPQPRHPQSMSNRFEFHAVILGCFFCLCTFVDSHFPLSFVFQCSWPKDIGCSCTANRSRCLCLHARISHFFRQVAWRQGKYYHPICSCSTCVCYWNQSNLTFSVSFSLSLSLLFMCTSLTSTRSWSPTWPRWSKSSGHRDLFGPPKGGGDYICFFFSVPGKLFSFRFADP